MKKSYILYLIFSLFFIDSAAVYPQWVNVSPNTFLTLFSVSAVDNNIVWACASGTNVFRTTNGGTSWQNVGTTIPVNGIETSIFALDENNALFACYEGYPVRNGYVFKTTNAGANWTQVFYQSNDALPTAIWMKNNNDGILVGWPVGGRWSLWRTHDGGSSWDSTGLYIPETNPNVWSFENSLFYRESEIWFGARAKGIYHSTNDGDTWTLQPLPGSFVYPSAIWIDNDYGLSSGNLDIVNTTDGGNSWGAIAGTAGTEVLRGVVGANNEWWHVREIDPNIYYSSDFGTTWSVQFVSVDNVGFRHVTKARNGNTIWAADISGHVYKYVLTIPVELISFNALSDAGKVILSWSTATETNNRGFEIQRNTSRDKEENSWYTIGYKEGKGTSTIINEYNFVDNTTDIISQNISYRLKQIDFNGTVSYSAVVEVINTPGQYSLGQNYPNPFNPSTTIEYSIPSQSFVRLVVYDVLGKTVSVLVNEQKDAGNYQLQFNAANLPSGVYYYKIEAGNFSQTKKLMITK